MSEKSALEFIPIDLRERDLYVKIAELMQFIIDGYEQDYLDIKNKYKDPFDASEDIITRVIEEYGFGYINNIISTLNNVETNVLFQFISLLHFYKGTRTGLELVLESLGFGFEIEEWHETFPEGEPFTFNMTVFMDSSKVTNVFSTLDSIRDFVKEYVYPVFKDANVVFDLEFVDILIPVAGFSDRELPVTIEDSI